MGKERVTRRKEHMYTSRKTVVLFINNQKAGICEKIYARKRQLSNHLETSMNSGSWNHGAIKYSMDSIDNHWSTTQLAIFVWNHLVIWILSSSVIVYQPGWYSKWSVLIKMCTCTFFVVYVDTLMRTYIYIYINIYIYIYIYSYIYIYIHTYTYIYTVNM
jgi:CBS domain containing-hemolysin-like protein